MKGEKNNNNLLSEQSMQSNKQVLRAMVESEEVSLQTMAELGSESAVLSATGRLFCSLGSRRANCMGRLGRPIRDSVPPANKQQISLLLSKRTTCCFQKYTLRIKGVLENKTSKKRCPSRLLMYHT